MSLNLKTCIVCYVSVKIQPPHQQEGSCLLSHMTTKPPETSQEERKFRIDSDDVLVIQWEPKALNVAQRVEGGLRFLFGVLFHNFLYDIYYAPQNHQLPKLNKQL